MKLVDDIVNKYGYSNLLHILIAALLTAYFGFFGFFGLIVGIIVTLLVCVKKEHLDTYVNKQDIKFGIYGIIFSTIIWIITYLINLIL